MGELVVLLEEASAHSFGTGGGEKGTSRIIPL